jgi:pimeloyl-ACP methyl ester carboxylesterase
MPRPTTFVLVHPAWHGGWCWSKLARRLRAAGHEVLTPTLTGLGERAHLARPDVGLATHVEDVVNVLLFEDLRAAVLVGHSSSGAVVTGAADRAPDRVAHVVYLDAFVPEDGQAILDLVPAERRAAFEALARDEGDGWQVPRFAPPPWPRIVREMWGVEDEADAAWLIERLRPTPIGHFRDPVRRGDPEAERLPRTYIRCTAFPHPGMDRFAAAARRTPGWSCRELAAPHHAAITHPQEVAALLLDVR